MKPDLRDWFAAHVAAALAAEQRLGPRVLAARAYDIADALLAERGARLEADLADARERGHDEALEAAGLLDEAAPMEESDDELDPSWLEPAVVAPASARPGLARTQLELPISPARKLGA
ncbi:MAG TPA: hypothetical protein VGM56_09180 [Byssovorax sp.]